MNKSNEIFSRDNFQILLTQIENYFNTGIVDDIISENQIGTISRLEDYVYHLNKSPLQLNSAIHESQFNLSEIIDLSDRLYIKFLTVSRMGIPNLGKYYLRILNALDSFLECMEVNHFNLLEYLSLSKYSYSNLRIFLRKELSDLNKKLSVANYSKEFTAVVNNGIIKIIRNKSITYSQVNSLRLTLTDLNLINMNRREEILIYLIKRNFNPTDLYDYCVNLVDQILINEPNLYKKIDHLITLQEEILKIQLELRLSQVKTRNTLLYNLKMYLYKKRVLLGKKLVNKIKQIKNLATIEDTSKIYLDIPVTQFAFLIRLFMVENILTSENKGKIFEFFAHSFKTKNSPFISKDSLWKKSRTVEVATASAVKNLLINMINRINKEYTANYSK